MIPGYLTAKLESVQRQALKIIYGWNRDIDEIMAIKNIETLEERREKALLNFALKMSTSRNMGRNGSQKKMYQQDAPDQAETNTKYQLEGPIEIVRLIPLHTWQ